MVAMTSETPCSAEISELQKFVKKMTYVTFNDRHRAVPPIAGFKGRRDEWDERIWRQPMAFAQAPCSTLLDSMGVFRIART